MTPKKVLIISVIVLVIGLVPSILVCIFGDVSTGIVFVILSLVTTLFLDIRLTQICEKDRFNEKVNELIKESCPVLAHFNSLQHSCSLFKKISSDMYENLDKSFQEMLHGKFESFDLSQVRAVLEELFIHMVEVKEICAVSHGEIEEWRENDAWHQHFIHMHEQAIKRGVKLSRVFVFHEEREENDAADVLQKHLAMKIHIKTILTDKIERHDFLLAQNCLLFFGTKKKTPLYVLIAHHSNRGQFVKSDLFWDETNVKAGFEAFERINRIAMKVKPESDAEKASEEFHIKKSR